jgi:hypothetical protein
MYPANRTSQALGYVAGKTLACRYQGSMVTEQPYAGGQPGDAEQAVYDQHDQVQYDTRPNEPPHSVLGERGFSIPYPRQPEQFSDTKGFFSALFDLGFTSFVTPKVVKVLYILTMIGAALSGLGFALFLIAFNRPLGILALFIWTPLTFVIIMALTRVALEYFVVNFRLAEDIRAIRERTGLL